MRFQTNLSRRPFHNRKLFWLGFILLMAMTILGGRWSLAKIADTDTTVQRLQAHIDKQQQELKELNAKQQPGQLILTEAQVKQLQGASELIEQRSFSWTAMLEELERELPATVRISSISLKSDKVDLASEGLNLSMKIYAKSVDDVTKMISQMDKRGIFRIQPRTQLALQSGDISFDLEVTYLPSHQPKPTSDKKKKANENEVAKEGRD